MCEDCEEPDVGGYFDMPYDRDYRNIDKNWEYLYGAEAFATNQDQETDVNFQGKFSDKEQTKVFDDIVAGRKLPSDVFITTDDKQTRMPKTKTKRTSNNDFSEKVFPSGLIQGSDQNIPTESVVPALRGQMPTFANTIIPASQVSSACVCSKNFMWDNNRGSSCEAKGMPCMTPGQKGMELL